MLTNNSCFLLSDYDCNHPSIDYDHNQPQWQNEEVNNEIRASDLVGAHEIAERLGLSFPNVVHTWRRRHKDFPKPVRELQAGLIWDWNEIQAWVNNRRSK
jgi:predicted DNA-binding transcriptional regulator AlpA